MNLDFPRSVRPTRSLRTGRARRIVVLTVLTAVVLGTAGCTGPTPSDGATVRVVAAFYPLQFVAERVGGGDVAVTNLTPADSGAHNLELTPGQVGQLLDADLVVYQSGFQPAIDEAVDQNRPEHVVDAAHGADLVDQDPHFWLDPTRLAAVVDQVAAALSDADPERATAYADRARTLVGELDTLNGAYRERLEPCSGATLVTAHTAFGYLADRYDLRQIGITGIDPDIEPSPARVRDVADVIRTHSVRTIFLETRADPWVVATMAADAGVDTAVLDPIERQIAPGSDYLSVMRSNLDALRGGLTC